MVAPELMVFLPLSPRNHLQEEACYRPATLVEPAVRRAVVLAELPARLSPRSCRKLPPKKCRRFAGRKSFCGCERDVRHSGFAANIEDVHHIFISASFVTTNHDRLIRIEFDETLEKVG